MGLQLIRFLRFLDISENEGNLHSSWEVLLLLPSLVRDDQTNEGPGSRGMWISSLTEHDQYME